jgi:SAM-dependent methyltransferase
MARDPVDPHTRRLEEQARRPPVPDEERWNHSIHFHDELVAAIRPGTRRVLDVGCGEGQLTRRLASIAEVVVGLDPDAPSLDAARAQTRATNASFVRGSVVDPPFRPAAFDAVVCVMALHHVDLEVGLTRLVELLAPGGTLGVIGFGRSRMPWDLPYDAAGAVMTRVHQRRRGLWEHPSPVVWPPPDTYPELRAAVDRHLPGASFERKVLWRYVLTWTKPS